MEQFINNFGPPASDTALKHNLKDCGKAENYLQVIKHPTFYEYQFHSHPSPPSQKGTPCYGPEQRPMDIDNRPRDKRTCYNCGKPGYITHNWKKLESSTKKALNLQRENDPKELEIIKLELKIAQLEKSMAKGKAKEIYEEEFICSAEDLKEDNEWKLRFHLVRKVVLVM